jgi:hypothetical protein
MAQFKSQQKAFVEARGSDELTPTELGASDSVDAAADDDDDGCVICREVTNEPAGFVAHVVRSSDYHALRRIDELLALHDQAQPSDQQPSSSTQRRPRRNNQRRRRRTLNDSDDNYSTDDDDDDDDDDVVDDDDDDDDDEVTWKKAKMMVFTDRTSYWSVTFNIFWPMVNKRSNCNNNSSSSNSSNHNNNNNHNSSNSSNHRLNSVLDV